MAKCTICSKELNLVNKATEDLCIICEVKQNTQKKTKTLLFFQSMGTPKVLMLSLLNNGTSCVSKQTFCQRMLHPTRHVIPSRIEA